MKVPTKNTVFYFDKEQTKALLYTIEEFYIQTNDFDKNQKSSSQYSKIINGSFLVKYDQTALSPKIELVSRKGINNKFYLEFIPITPKSTKDEDIWLYPFFMDSLEEFKKFLESSIKKL